MDAKQPMNEVMDPLADLAGWEAFDSLLEREEVRRSRTGERLAVAVLDLDGLGAANADYGAAAGTEMLRCCADTLRRTLRGVDNLARTGPDEFSVLLHATGSEDAARWAERFEEALESSGQELPTAPISCSVGIADTDESPTLMEVAVRARRRMKVTQTVRKLRRARETGS